MACRPPALLKTYHTLRLSSLWILFHGLIVNGRKAPPGWKRTWCSTFSPVCSGSLLVIFLSKNHFVWADWLWSWFCTDLLTQVTSCMRIISSNDPGCTAAQTHPLAKAKELNVNLFYTQLDFDTSILTPLYNNFSIQQILLNYNLFFFFFF